MIIHYLSSDRSPKEGDKRVKKDGSVQYRKQRMISLYGTNGAKARVVSNGRPVFDWVSSGEEFNSFKNREDSGQLNYKTDSSKQKNKKGITVRLHFKPTNVIA